MQILEGPHASNTKPQESTAYPRRDPRVGSQYQTKILQNCTKNDGRTPPDRISHEHVYSYCCYDSKMESNEEESTDEPAASTTTAMMATRPILASYDLEASLQTETTPRGGLKVHSPSTEAHQFAQVAEPIVLSLGSSSSWSNTTTKNAKNSSHEIFNKNHSPIKGYTFKGGNQTPQGFMASSQNEDWRKDVFWQKYMLELQGRVAERSKRRPQRGTRKRRRGSNTSEDSTVSNGVNDDMPLCLEEMVEEQPLFAPQFGEDTAHSMAFLHYYHNGNAKAASMRLFTNLTAGKASKRRKLVKLKRLQQKKVPSVQSSESWRRVYEQTQLMSIIDHLEDKVSLPYGLKHCCLPQKQSRAKGGSNGDIMMLDAADTSKDDLKEAWTTILSIGRSVKDKLDGWASANSKTKAGKKIACSALLAFIRNAYRLEPPEVCFGSHHVMIEEVSHCLLAILEHVEAARNAQAEIRDKLYQESVATGSDSDALQKYVQGLCKVLPIRLDEENLLAEFREIVVEWEGKLGSSVESTAGNGNKEFEWGELEAAEQLALEAKSHGYVSKEMIDLKARIEKAQILKQKLLAWKQSCDEGNGGTMRTVSALAKELKKLKLDFSQKREFLEFYNVLQNWLDRTNIAIRSRMSLVEVRTLLSQGADFPLDLAEYVGKLKSRVSSAEVWLERLEDVVPCPRTASGEHDMLEWSKGMRTALYEGRQGLLQDIVSDGSRIPVEVEALKVLQVEIDAKNWTSKAQKWLPINEDNKKGKLTDLKDHIERAHNLRERLTFLGDQKTSWELTGEAELTAIVDAADSWLEQYKPFVDGDNRRNKNRRCLSLSKLRKIVAEEKEIFANIGLAAIKMSRILTQAESWYEKHHPLLLRCNLEDPSSNASKPIVDPTEMKNAVQAATSSISLDLEEAVALKRLADRIQNWFGQVGTVVKPKSKKHNQKFTTDEILELINESSTLPINVENEVSELRSHLEAVEKWKSHATKDLEEIGVSFLKIQEKMTAAYGPPNKFSIDLLVKNSDWGAEGTHNASEKKETMEGAVVESGADAVEVNRDDLTDVIALHDCPEERSTIQKLQTEARDIGVATVEADLLDLFDGISKWWLRSLKYLNSPREVFDKRYFGAFDRFADDGDKLVSKCTTFEKKSTDATDGSCESKWSDFVTAQLDRMKILRSERGKFVAWCDQAKEILADEKKLTLEKLKSLVKSSQKFPPVNGMVQEVRILADEVSKWAEYVRPIIHSGKKLDMPTVKALLESGEKLKVNTDELRTLRAAVKAVRKWTNRVKKCDLDQGDTKISTVNELINEHESLLIEMPDDLARLHQATQAYCICRRPYEGFMIGCDECGEWYHGPCIGVSQARADRFDKFVCVRCSMKNLFKNSAVGAVEITKKWTSRKCLKKARQVEHQKHQRKVRKETKDLEKLKAKLEKLERKNPQEQELPKQPKADNAEEGKAIADSTAEKPADKSMQSVEPSEATAEDKPTETVSGSVVATPPKTSTSQVADKTVETLAETVLDNAPNTLGDGTAKPKTETIAGSSAEPSAEKPGITPTDKITEKSSSESAEVMATEDQKPQDEVQGEVDKINNTMREIQDRLVDLQKKLKEQKEMEAIEDKNAEKLRKWCIRVRSFVLIPSTDELRENARPPLDGNISKIMETVLSEAEPFGIAPLNDVGSTRNLFKCMSWSLLGLSIINRKPTLEEMKMLISKATELRLPDEKALKTMKLMAHRAEQVRCKIQKVLAARPGESKPVKQSVLNELVASSESVALIIQESRRIYATIENKGIPPDTSDEESISAVRVNHGCISPHGHDPKKLWPPFALFGSPDVIELLGPECSLIPEDTSVIASEESTVTADQPKDCKAQVESQLQTASQSTEVRSTLIAKQPLSSAAIQSEDENKTDAEAVPMEIESNVAASTNSDTPMKDTAVPETTKSQLSENEESPVTSAADDKPISTTTDCTAAPLAVDTSTTEPIEAGKSSEVEKSAEPAEMLESQVVVNSEDTPQVETETPIDSTSVAEVSATEITSGVTPGTAATVVTSQTEDSEMTDVHASGVSETIPAAAEELPTSTSCEISSVTTGGASVASTNESPRPVSTKEEAIGQDPQEPPISASSTSFPASKVEAAGGRNINDAASEVAIAEARDRLIKAMQEVPVASTGDIAAATAKERLINVMQEVPIASTQMAIDPKEETQDSQVTVLMDTD